MDYHIQHQNDFFDLAKFPIFQQFYGRTTDESRKALEKLLLNSWSAEYALRITPVVNDEQYLQSRYTGLPTGLITARCLAHGAFLAVQGVNVSNEELIRKRIGNMVVRGIIRHLLLLRTGPIQQLPDSAIADGSSVSVAAKTDLLLPSREGSVQAELSQFLKTTRDQRVRTLRNAIQTNPKTALRSPKPARFCRNSA